ncbi:MAG: YceI family protein [Crocinitomicaceae bacterium]
MKKIGMFLCASLTLMATSCSTEPTTYKLDKKSSSLEWAANMSPEYGHTGYVQITEGSIVMEGDALKSGSFTIDMNTIKSTDLDEPKATYLAAHLMGTAPDENHPVDMFFNTPKFPKVIVNLGEYKNGKLGMALVILGKELNQDVAVKLTNDEKGASIKGDFALDLTPLEIPGLQVGPDGSQINPAINFKLNVVLKK